MNNTKTKKSKKASDIVNDLTDVKNVSNIGLTANTNGNLTWTTTSATVTVNANKGTEEPSQFQKLVERYMKCEKRTLAEMLAMRDIDDDPYKGRNFNEELQKLLNDPNTFRVPMDPVPPIQPNSPYIPPYPDAYCFNAPGNRCVRGNAIYVGKCDGCPWNPKITFNNDSSDGNPNRGVYTTCSCTYQNPCGKDKEH